MKPLFEGAVYFVARWRSISTYLFISLKYLPVPVEEWDKIFSINVRGAFLSYKYAAEQMVKQGRGGRIIGASSIAGKKGTTYKNNTLISSANMV